MAENVAFVDVEQVDSEDEDSEYGEEVEEEEEDGVERGEEEGPERVQDAEEEEEEEEYDDEEESDAVQMHEQTPEGESQESEGMVDIQGLSIVLGIEHEVLESLATADERFSQVMSKCIQALNKKTDSLDQYEQTVKQFSENLSNADVVLRKLLALCKYVCMCFVGVL